MLNDRGYHIGFSGKVWSPGSPGDAPYGGGQFAYIGHGTRFNHFGRNLSEQPDIEAVKRTLYDEVRGNFGDFLKARPAGKPFCYWFGPTNTHREWVRGSGKKLWGLDPDALQAKLPKCLPDVAEVREDVADYLGEVQGIDAMVGVLLHELTKTGELENTLIITSGDHGMPGVTHGKCNLYDLGVQVSLAIRWGKKIPPNRVIDDFVCLPDLCPTILEAAGVTPPEVMTGRSLLGVLSSDKQGTIDPARDAVIVGRERHFARAGAGNLPYPHPTRRDV